MRKILLCVAALIAVTSCTVPKYYSKTTYLLDFRPYAEQGFLMSTTTIGESYKALGDIMIECESGYVQKTGGEIQKSSAPSHGANAVGGGYQDPVYTLSAAKNGDPKRWQVQEVLDLLHEEAQEIGADGVINIRLTSTDYMGFTDFEISGLAIKLIN